MSLQNIALLVNSRAGKNKALQVASYLMEQLTQRNIAHTVYTDSWPDALTNHTEAWIAGGDGTLNYFINKYSHCSIPIAIFKGGTGNDIAWKLYGNIDTPSQLELVLQATPLPVDAGMCNDKLFINGIGIGFDGEVLQSIKAIRFIGGHLGYLIAVIGKIFSFNEHRFHIEIDGVMLSDAYLLMMVFNSSRTGGGFHVAPPALMNDGLLNAVFCKSLSVFNRLRYLPMIEKGQHLKLPFIHHNTVSKVTITCISKLPAQCDGELIYHNRFDIKVLPGMFLFKY